MNETLKRASAMSPAMTNHQGGKAYAPTFEETLAEFFSLGLLNGNFYESEEQVLKNASDLFTRALTECPIFATKAAIYGSQVNSMKLVPMLWLAYLSTLEDKYLFQAAFPRIITNPKMLFDFMEIVRKTSIRQGLGRSLKRAMNTWLHDNLNDYYATRYKGKLAEIAKVSRPTYKEDAEFQKYMKYISKDELTIERAVALKKLIDDISNGIYNKDDSEIVKKFRIQLEEVKHSVSTLGDSEKKNLYKDLYKTMSYMALIMNLVALERVFATKTTETFGCNTNGSFKNKKVVETKLPRELIEMVADRITDINAYRRSKILPFTLLTATKMVVTPEFKTAISKMFHICAEEYFSLSDENSVLVGVDTSASMTSALTNSLQCYEVSTLFGAMIKKAYPKANICAVASTCKTVNLKAQESIESMMKNIYETNVGYGTSFESILSRYNGEKNIVIITDGEQSDNFERAWERTKHPEGARVIVWQLMPYHHVISKNSRDFIYLRGYSEKMLSVVKNIIEEKGNNMDEINAIVI